MPCRAWVVLLCLMLAPSPVRAQEEPKPDQLKKQLDEALGQLKSAQDRKAELAGENEKLVARLAEMQKQLDATKSENESLKRDSADFAEKSFLLRSHMAAWQAFVRQYPKVMNRWKVWLESDLYSSPKGLMELDE